MLTRLFNNLSIQSLISALLVSYLLTGLAVFFDVHYTSVLTLPATSVMVSPFLFKLLVFILLPLLSFWLNSLLISLGFLKNHYHILLLFCLQVYLFGFTSAKPEILLALPFLILTVTSLLKMISTSSVLAIVFDIGLLTGVMTLFFPEGSIVILFVWMALIAFGQFNLKAFIIPVMGVFAVYFVVFSAFFFFSEYDFIAYIRNQYTSLQFGFRGIEPVWLVNYIPVALVLIPAIAEYFKAVSFAKIKKRQMLNFMLGVLIITFVFGSLVEDRSSIYFFMALPLSVLQANLIQYLKKWWIQDLVYLAVISSLALVVFTS